jgi:hypothetical protein
MKGGVFSGIAIGYVLLKSGKNALIEWRLDNEGGNRF